MENLVERLEEYRLRQRHQKRIENFRGKIRRIRMFGGGVKNAVENDVPFDPPADNRFIDDRIPMNTDTILETVIEDDELSSVTSATQLIPDDESPKEHLIYKYAMWILSFLFWVTVYAIAIELQFGTVYFILSLFVGLYLNTRTGPKRPNEISAYSVFNKNCESIEGTLKAEQFERELGINRLEMP